MTEHERAVLKWASDGDTGVSSQALACKYLDIQPRYGQSAPTDSADFGRCYRLLRLFPEIRPCVNQLAESSTTWAKLAPIWDELMQLGDAHGLSVRGAHAAEISRRIESALWTARP